MAHPCNSGLKCHLPSHFHVISLHAHTHTHTLSFLPLFPSLFTSLILTMDFPGGSDCKASAYNAGDMGSIHGSGKSPGEGNGNPLQYSCLENPMDREAWWATGHGVAKSQTRLSDFTSLPLPPCLLHFSFIASLPLLQSSLHEARKVCLCPVPRTVCDM